MGYQMRRRARYYETDQMSIVHHSNYIRWVEEARVEFMRAIGCSCRELEEQGVIIPVTEVSAKYHVSVRFDDEVVIDTRVVAFNGVRLELAYEIRFAESGVLAVSAASGHCFVNPAHVPIAIRRRHPEVYARLLAAVEPPFGSER